MADWQHVEISFPFASEETCDQQTWAAFKREIDYEYMVLRREIDRKLYPYAGAREQAIERLKDHG